MARLLYVHWNKDEALTHVRELRDDGHAVRYHWSSEWGPKERAAIKVVPDVYVISLARLPSHGRRFANWARETKQRSSVPLIFVDGEPDKVAVAREEFPGTTCCSRRQLPKVLRFIETRRASMARSRTRAAKSG